MKLSTAIVSIVILLSWGYGIVAAQISKKIPVQYLRSNLVPIRELNVMNFEVSNESEDDFELQPLAASPEIVGATYSGDLIKGSEVTFYLEAKNSGSLTSDEGYLTMSLPDFCSVNDYGKSTSITDAVTNYVCGQTMYKCDGSQSSAIYTFVDGYESGWSSGETHKIWAKVTPYKTGKLYIHAKMNIGNLRDPSGPCNSDDQQGWPVKKYYVDIQNSTLNITSLTPTSTQVKDWGGSVTYTITVKDQMGNPLNGAVVSGSDNLMLQSFQTSLTNSSGQTSYTTTVPSGKSNGTYSITFTASKSGYDNSSTLTRNVQVDHRSLNITSITPASTQVKDWGESVIYTVTVKDDAGNPVSGAVVGGSDNLLSQSYQTSQANSNGQTSYTTTVPNDKADGTYSITFVAI